MKSKSKLVGEYVAHLAVGAAMFAALLLFGGALSLLVQWVAPVIGDEAFVSLMKIVEKAILYADVAFIVWWAIYSTYKAIKEMIDD